MPHLKYCSSRLHGREQGAFGVGLHRLGLKSTEVILKSSKAVAELDFKITEVDLSGVARGDPPQTSIKSINEAVPELDFIFT